MTATATVSPGTPLEVRVGAAGAEGAPCVSYCATEQAGGAGGAGFGAGGTGGTSTTGPGAAGGGGGGGGGGGSTLRDASGDGNVLVIAGGGGGGGGGSQGFQPAAGRGGDAGSAGGSSRTTPGGLPGATLSFDGESASKSSVRSSGQGGGGGGTRGGTAGGPPPSDNSSFNAGAGGGGGSSYGGTETGTNTGDGSVVITYTAPATTTPKPSTAAALGLNDAGTQLISFSPSKPSSVTRLGIIDGLGGDTRLVGIDYRVQDRNYYGVGDRGGIYTITAKGNVSKVSQLTVALQGDRFGVDFNPAADRLRIVSDTGQNLRHNLNPGGITNVDTPLTYPATSGTGREPAQGIVGAGYTNNDQNADTATVLYDLDTLADRLALQQPANDGTLSAVGSLGVKVEDISGFDILTKVSNNRAVSNTAYASLRTAEGRRSSLYTVNLGSGKVTRIGSFGTQIADIALRQPNTTAP